MFDEEARQNAEDVLRNAMSYFGERATKSDGIFDDDFLLHLRSVMDAALNVMEKEAQGDVRVGVIASALCVQRMFLKIEQFILECEEDDADD